jgi:hypothetical protein
MLDFLKPQQPLATPHLCSDPVARRKAADLLGAFRRRRINNDELWNSWPASKDTAVSEAFHRAVWAVDDSTRRHYYVSVPDGDGLLLKWEAFLRSDLPYVWYVPSRYERIVTTLASLGTLGLANLLFFRRWYAQLDFAPFPSKEAMERHMAAVARKGSEPARGSERQ